MKLKCEVKEKWKIKYLSWVNFKCMCFFLFSSSCQFWFHKQTTMTWLNFTRSFADCKSITSLHILYNWEASGRNMTTKELSKLTIKNPTWKLMNLQKVTQWIQLNLNYSFKLFLLDYYSTLASKRTLRRIRLRHLIEKAHGSTMCHRNWFAWEDII